MKHLLGFILIFLAVNIFGQTSPEKVCDKPYIEVTGTAEREVIPDEIYIGIILKEKYDSRIKVTIEEQEEKLKQLLKSLNIDPVNLSLSSADADYVKISWQKKDVLTKKNYLLKVGDASTVGKVFQGLESLEITDANIAKVNYSKMDSLQKEVRILAIRAAKDKADYLLAAIGEKTGKPLVINENANPSPFANNVRGSRSADSVYYIDGIRVKGDDNELQFQKIKVQMGIYVKFAIE